MGFPERLRLLIDEQGKDVKTFVKEFNSANLGVSVSESNMSSLLRGKTECKYGTIIALAKYFNVSADYLLGLTDVRTADMDVKKACDTVGINADLLQRFKQLNTSESYKEYMAVLNFLMLEYNVEQDDAILDCGESEPPHDTITVIERLRKVTSNIGAEYEQHNEWPYPSGKVTFGNTEIPISQEDFRNLLFDGLRDALNEFGIPRNPEFDRYSQIVDELFESVGTL